MTSAIASLERSMPPSTLCSAGMSCGGVRSNSGWPPPREISVTVTRLTPVVGLPASGPGAPRREVSSPPGATLEQLFDGARVDVKEADRAGRVRRRKGTDVRPRVNFRARLVDRAKSYPQACV